MRIVKDYPPNQLIPAQVECFNYILKHFKKHHAICNGREFYYWDKGCLRLLFGYKGPVLVLLPKGKKSSGFVLTSWHE